MRDGQQSLFDSAPDGSPTKAERRNLLEPQGPPASATDVWTAEALYKSQQKYLDEPKFLAMANRLGSLGDRLYAIEQDAELMKYLREYVAGQRTSLGTGQEKLVLDALCSLISLSHPETQTNG